MVSVSPGGLPGSFGHVDVDHQRFWIGQRLDVVGRLHHLAAVDADLAGQIEVVEVGEVDLHADVGGEEPLQHEPLQPRHQRARDAGEQLGAGHARHREMQIDVGDDAQRLAVREAERPGRHGDVPGEARRHVAHARLGSLQLQPARHRIDRAAQVEPEGDVLDRVGGQRVALQRQADHRQLAAELDRVAQPVEIQRRVERGVLRASAPTWGARRRCAPARTARPAGPACRCRAPDRRAPSPSRAPRARRRSCRADRSPGRRPRPKRPRAAARSRRRSR